MKELPKRVIAKADEYYYKIGEYTPSTREVEVEFFVEEETSLDRATSDFLQENHMRYESIFEAKFA